MGNEQDLVALVKRYLRQETVDPLRSIGRTLLFGVFGSLLMGTGAVLLSIGALRLLQGWAPMDATWSFLPYLIVSVVLLALSCLALRQVPRSDDSG
ncbi:MAG: hypothetical protein QF367_10010 [Acidimicrobiales bacterium]|jgi:hypothetical protein|nr:hypothetical protein [Actinomycetes bacterium]MDP6105418.1 hypothetical protein [Acidimicrobiales bacterium]MCP4845690.1 hypothetical protein [Actinomycetes bacterium]MDP6240197.1 hypothetical protein [Acidimicrobiales bacterium]MDP7125577.1 hypothetical protein [Acidimicrobiales bacterium]|tara:strand:- start:8818 stop:9105 length:288 start_codon:yes stop_codon:yes gene_type:complete